MYWQHSFTRVLCINGTVVRIVYIALASEVGSDYILITNVSTNHIDVH